MNSDKVKELSIKAAEWVTDVNNWTNLDIGDQNFWLIRDTKFAELIVQECIDKIETYRIPCGNSPEGEMACEWTYDALKSIRDDIKETFAVE